MRLAVLLLTLASLAFPQLTGDANRHYKTQRQRQEVAEGLLGHDRDHDQKPEKLVESLPIRPGMTVADIGTGSGYMLPFLSRAVGPRGRVMAEDVFPDFLEAARRHAAHEDLKNITLVLGTRADPQLPAGAIDVAFFLDVYHHVDEPVRLLTNLRPALKPDGVVVIVDYYRRPNSMPWGDSLKHIRADQPQVIKEVESSRYRLVNKFDHIHDSQYVLVFRKAGGGRDHRRHRRDD